MHMLTHTHTCTNEGEDVDLSNVMDPHTITGLLKLHFREQRVSLIPRGQPLAEIVQGVKARNVSMTAPHFCVHCQPRISFIDV